MNSPPDRSTPTPKTRNAAAHGAWWVHCASALALAVTCMLVASGAPGDWIGAVWLAAVLWTIAASLAQALRAGIRDGDWSAFACANSPRAAQRREDPDFDFATRSGLYAHLRVRDEHESLTREGDRCLQDHDRTLSLD